MSTAPSGPPPPPDDAAAAGDHVAGPATHRIAGIHGHRIATSDLNWANVLTVFRIVLVPVIVLLIVAREDTARWWAFAIFLLAAFTDTIDGWLARRAVGISRLGQLADPIADKLLIVGSLGVLAYVGDLPWWAVIIIVIREMAVTMQRVWLLRRGVVMPASRFGKAKTVTQVLAVTLYLMPAGSDSWKLVALFAALLFTVASGIEYAWRGQRLLRQNEAPAA